jgi:SAM-dependent methyltransferase
MSIRVSAEIALEPSEAFEVFVEELSTALANDEMHLSPGFKGHITDGNIEVGRFVKWLPGQLIQLEWHQADWKPGEVTKLDMKFEKIQGGTCLTLEHHEWGKMLEDSAGELVGWFSSQVAAPLVRAMRPKGFGDWLTDRRARRPTGAKARETYRDPTFHRPNFRAIIEVLKLTSADYLLEIGCGGGAFLREALVSGCRAAGIDHSSEMVRVAREANASAITEHRLELLEAEADELPYPDKMFTCAVMTGVFGFLEDPVKVLTEIRRVLSDDGRLVIFVLPRELRGTPAAPEPIASRIHFYEDQELLHLARKAGFRDVHVEHPDLDPYARELGLPKEFFEISAKAADQLLIARKS